MSDNRLSLPRAESPESVGINSSSIVDFLDDIHRNGIELHSFMLLRHGKVAAECYWKPFSADMPHTMFSVSKSVVSTAIGFAVSEGLMSVEDRVYDFFPEYSPRTLSAFAKELKVEHLLTMTSGKFSALTVKLDRSNWVKIYLDAPFISEPGTRFNYMSDNSYMLSAIVKKVTGQNVTDYLMSRFFEPLDIERPFWEKCPRGIEAGGWGLRLKTEDLAKIILCYMNNGKYDGKQVVPADWARTATAVHVEKTPGTGDDQTSGYGYQFWRNSVDNSFRADGVFAQLGVALPDYDACLITTGGETMERYVLETFWKYFPKTFSKETLPENNNAFGLLRERINTLALPSLYGVSRRKDIEEKINGKLIRFPNAKQATILTVVSNFMRDKKSGYMNNFIFDFRKDRLVMSWTEKYDDLKINVGYEGKELITKVTIADYPYTFSSSCAWQSDGSLEVHVRPLEQTQVKMLNFRFVGNNVYMKNLTSRDIYSLAVFGLDFKGLKADDVMKTAAKGLSGIVKPMFEPDIAGKFRDKIF